VSAPAIVFVVRWWIFCLLVIGSSELFGQLPYRDGSCDIYWQNRKTGQVSLWHMRQAAFLDLVDHIQTSGPTNLQVVAVADFNQDGDADLLWQNTQTGELRLWLMRGPNRLTTATLPTADLDYALVGTGDFNGDGWVDVLWRQRSQPSNVVWFMEGTNHSGNIGWIAGPADPHWVPAATADFDNDGSTDILWRNPKTGQNMIGFMDGIQRFRDVEIASEPDPHFALVGTGQFNRLGHVDLIWRHLSGTNLIWLMCGTNRLGIAPLPMVPDPDWTVVGTGGYTNSLMLSATGTSSPASITLHWRFDAARCSTVDRRSTSETHGTSLGLHRPSQRLTDTNVVPDRLYEYRLGDDTLWSGIHLPPVAHRGRVLVLVDETLLPNRLLQWEINRLHTNLVGDGWRVTRKSAPRHDDRRWELNPPRIMEVKKWITEFQRQAPQDTNMVLILGHVVIPYSGSIASDGHAGVSDGKPAEWNDHRGAWVADGFYGDLDTSLWTDSRVYVKNSQFPECSNKPWDGKFDNDLFPSEVELAIGRIDFAKLPWWERPEPKQPPRTETDLLVQYLRKNDRYRKQQLVFPDRLLMGGFFGTEGLNASLYATALRHGSRWFGMDPSAFAFGDLFQDRARYLWGFLAGHGAYQAIQGDRGIQHLASDLTHPDQEPSIGFYLLQGSWFADWNLATNNLLRCLLASPNSGLAVFGHSSYRIRFHAERLAMGETLGAEWMRTVNQSLPWAERWLSLLGDPTLRLQITPPPSGLTCEKPDRTRLHWQPTPGIPASYWVLRSKQGIDGPWVLLTPAPISRPEYVDTTAPPGPKLYQVRALQEVTTGSGSFTNSSQGIFVTVD
jgi:hypothetical protein